LLLHGQSYGRRDGAKRPLTTESMIRVYRQEADRQRLLIKKAEVTQNRLLFVVEAMRALREDHEFSRLLQMEKLGLMPAFLEQQLGARPEQ
jgi:ParB family chromosome partitioning protein